MVNTEHVVLETVESHREIFNAQEICTCKIRKQVRNNLTKHHELTDVFSTLQQRWVSEGGKQAS